MAKIRIIRKNSDSYEYEIGDIFEIAGTWYGGVHIAGKTGIPVSLDKSEYMLLDTEPELPDPRSPEEVPRIRVGDIVQHFKREWVDQKSTEYVYRILAIAQHTETGEHLVIYQAMYPPYKTCARPYEMFMSKVDTAKYPDVKQEYRFEKVKI